MMANKKEDPNVDFIGFLLLFLFGSMGIGYLDLL